MGNLPCPPVPDDATEVLIYRCDQCRWWCYRPNVFLIEGHYWRQHGYCRMPEDIDP